MEALEAERTENLAELGEVGDILDEKDDADPFVSKFGGRFAPAVVSDVGFQPRKCSTCNLELVLVVQLHAPFEVDGEMLDRFLYLLACNSEKCPKRDWAFLRSQIRQRLLPPSSSDKKLTDVKKDSPKADLFEFGSNDWGSTSDNFTFGYNPPNEKDDLESLLRIRDMKLENASAPTSSGSSVETVDVKYKPVEKPSPRGFLPHYIEWISEQPKKKRRRRGKVDLPEAVFNDTEGEWAGPDDEPIVKIDKTFEYFRKRMERLPNQCLRFGGDTLWIQNHKEMLEKEAPRCPRCNSARVYEFEILPPLMAFLSPRPNFEFGVIACYSCDSSCGSKDGRSLFEEYCEFQDAL